MTAEPGLEDAVYELEPACTVSDLDSDRAYLATVNGVVEYGVFVDLSEEISGLVHESALDTDYAVGDQLVVTLDQIRDNGDIAFSPTDIDPDSARIETVAHSYEITPTIALETGEPAHLEGEVVQIKQTGGPTIFQIRDGNGVVPSTAFEAAGVRAYPDIEVGDLVSVRGLNLQGTVASLGEGNGEAEVNVGNVRLLLEMRRLSRVEEAPETPAAGVTLDLGPGLSSMELDMRGMRVEEALIAL
ncbi:MAG: S1 RNA-binding domain-containing protein, partial [Euryarchaeota archaeon]|nr:S1 RNA-binding domain-containing protein [Euryarchaeota archaeon]